VATNFISPLLSHSLGS